MGVIEVGSHSKWNPNDFFPTFVMKSNSKQMLDIEEARVRTVINNLDSIINDLSNLKGMMGSATGMSSQISNVINSLLDYRNSFFRKNKNMISYTEDMINLVRTNKETQKNIAVVTTENIDNINIPGGK